MSLTSQRSHPSVLFVSPPWGGAGKPGQGSRSWLDSWGGKGSSRDSDLPPPLVQVTLSYGGPENPRNVVNVAGGFSLQQDPTR